jgi:hypothetical protein
MDFFLYELLLMGMQKLRVMGSVDICKQIFLHLSSWNFIQ